MTNRFIKVDDPAYDEYEKWDFTKLMWYSRPYEYKWMSETIASLGEDIELLDAACGYKTPGYHIAATSENVKSVTALDLGKGYARNFITNGINHEKVTKVVADLTTWIPDKQYDVVVCISSMEHIPNWKEAIKTMYTALNTGGHLILTLDIAKGRRFNQFLENYKFSPADYKVAFEEVGFTLKGGYDDNTGPETLDGGNSSYGPSKHTELQVFRFLLEK